MDRKKYLGGERDGTNQVLFMFWKSQNNNYIRHSSEHVFSALKMEEF